MNDPQVVRNEDEVITFSPSRVFDSNSYPSGGVGMIGTAREYLIFLETLRTRNNPILQPESIELMTKNAIGALPAPLLDPGWRFGLGFAVLEDAKPTASPTNPGSWGGGGGYGNSFLVDPAERLSVVALNNTAVAGLARDFPESVVREASRV